MHCKTSLKDMLYRKYLYDFVEWKFAKSSDKYDSKMK